MTWIACFLWIRIVQVVCGAVDAPFGMGPPDEPAHFIGSLLTHDFLLSAWRQSPLSYAIDYYVRIPYFGIGVWPPLFGFLQALWMFFFGTNRAAALLFSAAMAAALAMLVSRIFARRFGEVPGMLAAAIVLSLAAVQQSACLVMVDIPVTLFCLAAVYWFARYLGNGTVRNALLFGLFSTLAIYTKSSAYYLAFIPVFVVLASRRWNLLRPSSLWIAPLMVATLYAPWLIYSRKLLLLGLVGLQSPGIAGMLWMYLRQLAEAVNWLLIPAAFGLFYTLRRLRRLDPESLCMLAVLPSLFLSIYFAGVAAHARYLILADCALVWLAFEGVCALWAWVRPGRPVPVALLPVMTVLFCASHWLPLAQFPVNRIRPAVAVISARDGSAGGSVLVPSKSEGPWIAEFAQAMNPRPGRLLVRPTKVLAREDWNGGQYVPFYHTADELAADLEKAPYRFCVLASGEEANEYFHDKLLRQVIAGSPARWQLIYKTPANAAGGFEVYQDLDWSPRGEVATVNLVRDRLAGKFK